MWLYWFQSIIIGFFNFIRILQLKEFSTRGLKINNHPVNPSKKTKIKVAFIFLFNYGVFHFFYLLVLLLSKDDLFREGKNIVEWGYIWPMAILFFINHLFSYFYNRLRDTKKLNIGSLMIYPYARILPMHFTILFGVHLMAGSLLFFLLLKTIADGIMHIVEHQILRKGES